MTEDFRRGVLHGAYWPDNLDMTYRDHLGHDPEVEGHGERQVQASVSHT